MIDWIELFGKWDAGDPSAFHIFGEAIEETSIPLERRFFPFEKSPRALNETALGYSAENLDCFLTGGQVFFVDQDGGPRGRISHRRIDHCKPIEAVDSFSLKRALVSGAESEIETAALHMAVMLWRRHDPSGFAAGWEILRNYGLPVSLRYFADVVKASRASAEEMAEKAFEMAMEELDLIVAGGFFLTTREVSGKHLGGLTGRKLGSRGKFVVPGDPVFESSRSGETEPAAICWRGSIEFKSLFRDILAKRGLDVRRKSSRDPQVGGLNIDDVNDSMGVRKDLFNQIVIHDDLAALIKTKLEQLDLLVAELEQVTVLPGMDRQHAAGEIAELLARAVSRLCMDGKNSLTQTDRTIDSLCQVLEDINDAGSMGWAFVREEMSLKRNAFYQRKARFLSLLKHYNLLRTLETFSFSQGETA